jgi:hypothetical protein
LDFVRVMNWMGIWEELENRHVRHRIKNRANSKDAAISKE